MFIRFEERRTRKRERSDYVGARKRRLKPIEELRPRRVAICQCDSCGVEFEKDTHPSKIAVASLHFCSVACKIMAQRDGGPLCKRDTALTQPDILKRAIQASHSPEAEMKRSASLKTYYSTRPEAWTNPGNNPDACAKRHKTMKRNGTYRKSRVEDELYTFLVERFGEADVERNHVVNEKWPIDFFVKSKNIFIQLDGVYWHGLDRPIEIIAEHVTPRDRVIHKKWMTDREQDEWFSERGLSLIRITDVEFKRGVRPCV